MNSHAMKEAQKAHPVRPQAYQYFTPQPELADQLFSQRDVEDVGELRTKLGKGRVLRVGSLSWQARGWWVQERLRRRVELRAFSASV